VRPIVETGFENMLLVRYLHEKYTADNISTTADTAVSRSQQHKQWQSDVTEYILNNWGPSMRDELVELYGSNKKELIEVFGKARDDMIANDLDAWVGLNTVYPVVKSALQSLTTSDRLEPDRQKLDSNSNANSGAGRGDNSKLYGRLFIVTTKQVCLFELSPLACSAFLLFLLWGKFFIPRGPRVTPQRSPGNSPEVPG
jgi:hypothetical protein